MRKLGILVLSVFLTSIVSGVYGILHDQLTYTICPEYYTKFKFIQFGLAYNTDEAIFTNPRREVAIVGFMATWWVGVFVGLIQGLAGLIHKDHKVMTKTVGIAIAITLIITFTTGFLGFVYGKYFLVNNGVDWWLPDNLIDKESYVIVGSIHNFGYLGGLLGLIVGVIYQMKQKWILNKGT